ncbi:MAG: MlaE family ABC transporter permease, partial [Bdellovibrionales bacterium]
MIQFVTLSFLSLFKIHQRKSQVFQQLDILAVQSAPIILICVSFAAVVTVLESSFHMKLVIQSDSMVPGFSALLILRELGAIVTALLLTSRAGAGIASEVASQKVSEQIEALKLLGVNPYEYIVAPRLVASVLGTILLVATANVAALFISMLVSAHKLSIQPEIFWQMMNRFVEFKDFILSLLKAACFGAIIPLVSCYYGFRSDPGAEGVGKTTTQSVVMASILIIMFDFI